MYSVALNFLLAGHEALERDRSKEMRHFEDVTKALDIFWGAFLATQPKVYWRVLVCPVAPGTGTNCLLPQ